MPKATISKIASEVAKILQAPETSKRLVEMGADPWVAYPRNSESSSSPKSLASARQSERQERKRIKERDGAGPFRQNLSELSRPPKPLRCFESNKTAGMSMSPFPPMFSPCFPGAIPPGGPSVLYREVVIDALNSLDVSSELGSFRPLSGVLDIALQGHESLVRIHMHFQRTDLGVFRERRLHLRRDGAVVDGLTSLLARAC